jgi:uncharacterized protein
MQTLILALLLAAVFGLLVPSARNGLRCLLGKQRSLVWAVPFLLTAVFAAASLSVHAFSAQLTAIVLAYTAVPVACLWFGPHDFPAVLFLWLPLEFAGGVAPLIPRPAQGFLHSVAYGVAILLGLVLFLGFRNLDGMKYDLPRRGRDLWLPLAAFVVTAPVLIAIGIPIGFIPPPHLPTAAGGRMAAAFGIIFAGTGLPEEILFRALIQNLMFQRWGASSRVLLAASLIFGAAHLDNGPQPVPNWRYMILATVAGYAYGKVFEKSGTVLSSALLHALVDWTRHFFF